MINMQKPKKQLTKNWPIYMVVTPDKMGIYDDMCLAYQDSIGEDVHICKKYKLNECENSIESYFKYFYPNTKINRTYIQEKNRLLPVGSNSKNG